MSKVTGDGVRLAGAFAATFLIAMGGAATVASANARPVRGRRCPAGSVRRVERVKRRRHGKRVVVRQERCVRKRPHPPTPAPPAPPVTPTTISYSVSVTSGGAQARYPLATSYVVNADAIATTGSSRVDLDQTNQLPVGVVELFGQTAPNGPSQLLCSVGVGASVHGGTCQIAYPAVGAYQVTADYFPPDAAPVTQTISQTISPFSTTTALTASEGACSSSSPPGSPSIAGPYCEWTLTISTVDQNGNAASGTEIIQAQNASSAGPQQTPTTAGSCTMYVTSSWMISPDCGFQLGSAATSNTTWPVSASYEPDPGYATSSSPTVSLTP